VVDVGEEKTFVDGNVGGVLVGGGVGGALIEVPLSSYVRLATLLLVVVLLLLHLLFPFLVVVPITVTCIWTFSNIVTGLTTSVANPLGAGFVFLPLPFGWCRLFLFSFVALNAMGYTSGVEAAPCSKLTMCLESLTISSKLTNLPMTSSGDICLYLGFS
jgi:hypothetical protein